MCEAVGGVDGVEWDSVLVSVDKSRMGGMGGTRERDERDGRNERYEVDGRDERDGMDERDGRKK